jgi:hypothetical protein
MPSIDSIALARLTWACTAFVILGLGVGVVWWPSSQAISQVRRHAGEMYEEANHNDAIVRLAADLRAAQARVRADVNALGGTRSPGQVTAAALRLLEDEAKQRGVEIRSIVPSAAPITAGALVGTDVAIGARGPFRNIISFLADLPRHNVLMELRDAELISSDPTQKLPSLDATVHATIYRLTSVNTAEDTHVRAL